MRSRSRAPSGIARRKIYATDPVLRSPAGQLSVTLRSCVNPLHPPAHGGGMGRSWMVICIRGRRRRWKAAAAGFNAHASCIFKAPACYSCTRKLNPNARLRLLPPPPSPSPSPPPIVFTLAFSSCVLLFSLSLLFIWIQRLSLSLCLCLSVFSPLPAAEIYAPPSRARDSLLLKIKIQN